LHTLVARAEQVAQVCAACSGSSTNGRRRAGTDDGRSATKEDVSVMAMLGFGWVLPTAFEPQRFLIRICPRREQQIFPRGMHS